MNINLAAGGTVRVENGWSFENFVAQFQIAFPKILCVVDGAYIKYFGDVSDIPGNIRFDYKRAGPTTEEYYFRDADTGSLYCVFGRGAAKIFYRYLDDVDKPEKGARPSDNLGLSNSVSGTLEKIRKVDEPARPEISSSRKSEPRVGVEISARPSRPPPVSSLGGLFSPQPSARQSKLVEPAPTSRLITSGSPPNSNMRITAPSRSKIPSPPAEYPAPIPSRLVVIDGVRIEVVKSGDRVEISHRDILTDKRR